MQIFISSIDGELHAVDISQTTTVADLKAQLGVSDEILSYGSKILENETVLHELDLHPGVTFNLNARLLGGKVHGSLARAGKVRAQTPKVEKQEKKKKKTGRASRRIQYNRRFVNVAVSGPGRKRGPNSNAA
ncbi:unnamed protein product [Dracunculus medinensis]|uniref:40S ribosomal protein S30 n=1 Tax=Dracunculus medinensis TaxID=318479 RepID=A0A0N4UP59_DRAME|nr:unnamed protein product [Dracunculus medinensis]